MKVSDDIRKDIAGMHKRTLWIVYVMGLFTGWCAGLLFMAITLLP